MKTLVFVNLLIVPVIIKLFGRKLVDWNISVDKSKRRVQNDPYFLFLELRHIGCQIIRSRFESEPLRFFFRTSGKQPNMMLMTEVTGWCTRWCLYLAILSIVHLQLMETRTLRIRFALVTISSDLHSLGSIPHMGTLHESHFWCPSAVILVKAV